MEKNEDEKIKKGVSANEFGWLLIILGAIGFCIVFPPLTFLLVIILGVAILLFAKKK